MSESQKKKIVVLGGGLASMTAIFEMTNQPGWQDLYEITVYQLGWRLGGKCASGRNIKTHSDFHEPNYRVQEHGFHIFFGFYENAMRMMKKCYEEFSLINSESPFQTVQDAFSPHSFIVLEEFIQGKWIPWYLDYPLNDRKPWEGESGISSIWQYIREALKFMRDLYTDSDLDSPSDNVQLTEDPEKQPSWWQHIRDKIELAWDQLNLIRDSVLLEAAQKLAEVIDPDPEHDSEEDENDLIDALKNFTQRTEAKMEAAIAAEDDDTRRILIINNLGYATIRGLIADKATTKEGFNELDQYDYRQWLKRHGAWQATIDSPLVKAMYDLLLAFPLGKAENLDNGNLGAASALRWIIRMNFTYDGAIMWRMEAGMADTIFSPLYEVLKHRGVKFEFFHRVTNLGLDANSPNNIANITLHRQVNLKKPQQGYNPLISVKGLPCWPSEPLYDQIVEGQQLQDKQINLESFWSPWPEIHPEEVITLNYQQDFDIAILGISIGALPFIAKELIDANSNWKNMVDNIQTVTTQGGQLWLKPTLWQAGWTKNSPVVGTYVEPIDTYADMSHLIEKENWPSAHYPHSLAYFTGVMEDPGIPDATNYDFPTQEQQKIKEKAINYLQNNAGYLWPKAANPLVNPQGLNWDLLVDMDNHQGQDRFSSQFWRANIDPSDRYVLSVAGSHQYRLKADESGFDNLYLTGDWIDNGMNSGCAEATVMSGMQTAKAILQGRCDREYSKPILGEKDSWL